jgi:hypothetical protein
MVVNVTVELAVVVIAWIVVIGPFLIIYFFYLHLSRIFADVPEVLKHVRLGDVVNKNILLGLLQLFFKGSKPKILDKCR